MIQAVADENPVELVNSLSPSEMAFFGDVEQAASDALDGEGETADALEERGVTIDPDDLVPGLAVRIDELTYEVEEKSDDVAKVIVTSVTGEWSFDPTQLMDAIDIDALTNGEVTEDEALEQVGADQATSGSFDLEDLDVAGEGVFFMAVREDGGWYVSPLYTLLEYVTQIEDLPEGDFSNPAASGAVSPEEALERTVGAFFTATLPSADAAISDIIDTLPPTRYGAIYAYRDALDALVARRTRRIGRRTGRGSGGGSSRRRGRGGRHERVRRSARAAG